MSRFADLTENDVAGTEPNLFPQWAGDVPLGVVTVTSTMPLLPAGAFAVIAVAELTVNDVAAVEPNLTAVAPAKAVPVIVTDVPPTTGPMAGLSVVTAGTAPRPL